ncbi:hypothetical protein BDR06DRAFT_1012524 [Suillus hirtellus]|nr:hypothetical protein BDR06DRAFT_1012524 [Suillus hirtellus]
MIPIEDAKGEGYKQIVFFTQSCPAPAPAPAPAPPPPSPPSQQPFSQPSPPPSPQLWTPGAYQLSETIDDLLWDLAHPEMWNDCIELSEFDRVVE